MHFLTRTILCRTVFTRQRIKATIYLSASSISIVSAKMPTSGCNITKRFENIIKSSEDKRNYRGLELNNRMRVLLVSDPTTERSAAALDVNVGHLSDPDHIPGLAHFCEHMLFLGTEKYPDENDYSKFLSQHGGHSNAATYPDHTNYYFDVLPEHLKGALDRFSQFFLCPLFTESATDRELNAVHSEHEKNLSMDSWRLDQLERHTADSTHAYHKFGTGSKKTLEEIPKEKGFNVREELLKFHSHWYSSNIMSLAILGKESLDELEAMAVEMFAKVEDKNIDAPIWKEHPFKDDQLQTIIHVVPIKDNRSINIIFPCPDLADHYKSSPSGYISNLIGHEGPGSLLSALKERGWSNSLVAGYKSTMRGTAFFGVTLDLTEEGLDHTNDIIKMVFQYFNMLKQTEPHLWLHEEQRDIAAMNFRFKDKESPMSYISNVVHNLHQFPMEDILCNYYLLTEWKPEMITQLLDDFTPENIRVAIVAKKFESEATEKEPWYGTNYKKMTISEEQIKDWKNAGLLEELQLPKKNDFIPKNFDLYPLDKDITEFPEIIKDTPISRVWFKQDDNFLLPRAITMFDFAIPLAYMDPLNCALTHMFTQLFRDHLNQYAYAADLAGLKFDLINNKYGLILSVSGFSEKQHIFLEKIMDQLTNFKIDPKRFDIFKDNYVRALKNFKTEQPYQHAIYYLAVLMTEHTWTKHELLAATDQLTVDQLEAFIPQMLSKMHIESFLYGNVNRQKAMDLVDIVEGKLKDSSNMSPLLPRQLLLNRELKLEDGCDYLYEVQNEVHKLSCVVLYYQCGVQTKESNVTLELFTQVIQEPCFNILRTQEQLGYIVFSGLRRTSGVQGVQVLVQSDKHPAYVHQRIETFLVGMKKYLEEMSEEEFNKHKEALAARRLEKPKQLSTQMIYYWAEISTQQYHFDRANAEVAHLRTLTKQDLIDFYSKMIEFNSVERHKLGVHVVSTAEGGAGTAQNDDRAAEHQSGNQQILDVTAFKSSHGMHPLVQPYINITRKGNKCKL